MNLLRKPLCAYALLLVIGAALIASYVHDLECSKLLCRGDFPAFWSGAYLLGSSDLYNPKTQQQIQQIFWPSLSGSFLYFAYPPYAAAIIAPLKLLTPFGAKCVLIVLSFVALVFSARRFELGLPLVVTFAWLMLLPQNFIAIFSGQNLAFSLLCASLLLFAKSPRSRGLALGIWWFKPQFASVVTIGCLLSGRWREFLWSLIPLSGYYALAAAFQGPKWPIEWLSAIDYFSVPEKAINSERSISLYSVIERIHGQQSALAICAVLFLLLIFVSFRNKQQRLMPLWIVAAVLLSPRTMFYDFGICIPAIFALTDNRMRAFAVVFLAAALAAVFAPPIEPLMLCVLLLGISVYLMKILRA